MLPLHVESVLIGRDYPDGSDRAWYYRPLAYLQHR